MAALPYERKHSTLRIGALQDPPAAGHLEGTCENLPAAGAAAFRRRVTVAHVKVIEPEGNGHCVGLAEHAAYCDASDREQLVFARCTHVGCILSPPEQHAIEVPGRCRIGRKQLVPTGASRALQVRELI